MQRWSGLDEKQIAAACGYIAVLLFFDYDWDARHEVMPQCQFSGNARFW